jgi:flagellar assembly protein FliH
MSETQKFLFDTSFDSAAHARPEAEAEDAPEAPTFSEAELEQARAEALSTGREQGFRDAATSIEQTTAMALEEVGKGLEEILRETARFGEQGEARALGAAMTVVRKLFPGLAQRNGLGEIEGLVAECLGRLREEPRVVVRVTDELLDPLRMQLDRLSERCGFEGRVVLLADETLCASDVRVEWADGGAERDSRRLWHEIDQILAGALGPATQGAEPDQASDQAPDQAPDQTNNGPAAPENRDEAPPHDATQAPAENGDAAVLRDEMQAPSEDGEPVPPPVEAGDESPALARTA